MVISSISSSAVFHDKINAMSLLQNYGIGRKLYEMCHNCPQNPLCKKLLGLSNKHVELICCRTTLLRDEIRSICKYRLMEYLCESYAMLKKPVKTGLEAFLCFKLTNGHWAVKKLLYQVRRSAEHVSTCYKS